MSDPVCLVYADFVAEEYYVNGVVQTAADIVAQGSGQSGTLVISPTGVQTQWINTPGVTNGSLPVLTGDALSIMNTYVETNWLIIIRHSPSLVNPDPSFTPNVGDVALGTTGIGTFLFSPYNSPDFPAIEPPFQWWCTLDFFSSFQWPSTPVAQCVLSQNNPEIGVYTLYAAMNGLPCDTPYVSGSSRQIDSFTGDLTDSGDGGSFTQPQLLETISFIAMYYQDDPWTQDQINQASILGAVPYPPTTPSSPSPLPLAVPVPTPLPSVPCCSVGACIC